VLGPTEQLEEILVMRDDNQLKVALLRASLDDPVNEKLLNDCLNDRLN